MLVLLGDGGFKTGGFNFDAKVRRESTDPQDLFIAHIGGMDTFARGLLVAHDLLENSPLPEYRRQRYASFDDGPGLAFESGEMSLEDLRNHAAKTGEPAQISGRQEWVENVINDYIFRSQGGDS
jgi:xylose isomerase